MQEQPDVPRAQAQRTGLPSPAGGGRALATGRLDRFPAEAAAAGRSSAALAVGLHPIAFGFLCVCVAKWIRKAGRGPWPTSGRIPAWLVATAAMSCT
jgi:hypothetical protein